MRRQDLEKGIEDLKEIRNIASKQDYNTSVAINQKLIKTIPLLESEYNRMVKDNIDLDSPMYREITMCDCEEVHKTMEEFLNNYMAELVDNDFFIVDYGIIYIDKQNKYGYVKYSRNK